MKDFFVVYEARRQKRLAAQNPARVVRAQHEATPIAQALFVHRNTLEYRLRKIFALTCLDIDHTDDRFLLYIAVHMV